MRFASVWSFSKGRPAMHNLISRQVGNKHVDVDADQDE